MAVEEEQDFLRILSTLSTLCSTLVAETDTREATPYAFLLVIKRRVAQCCYAVMRPHNGLSWVSFLTSNSLLVEELIAACFIKSGHTLLQPCVK